MRTKADYIQNIKSRGIPRRIAEDLYKRDAGAVDRHKMPVGFTYKYFLYHQFDSDAFIAIYKHTDGPFVWLHRGQSQVVGFRYPSDLTMFLLSFQENRP